MDPDRMTIEEGGDALRKLEDELDATHAPPFAACLLDEHWEAIERALDRLVNAGSSLRLVIRVSERFRNSEVLQNQSVKAGLPLQ